MAQNRTIFIFDIQGTLYPIVNELKEKEKSREAKILTRQIFFTLIYIRG